jgi:hypothetical protein
MDGEPPKEEDFSQIPLLERSQHKVGSICHFPWQQRGCCPGGWDGMLISSCRVGKPGCPLTPTSSQGPQRQRRTPTRSSVRLSRMAHYCASGIFHAARASEKIDGS